MSLNDNLIVKEETPIKEEGRMQRNKSRKYLNNLVVSVRTDLNLEDGGFSSDYFLPNKTQFKKRRNFMKTRNMNEAEIQEKEESDDQKGKSRRVV